MIRQYLVYTKGRMLISLSFLPKCLSCASPFRMNSSCRPFHLSLHMRSVWLYEPLGHRGALTGELCSRLHGNQGTCWNSPSTLSSSHRKSCGGMA